MTTTTPNMNLILPDVGSTVGPTWATELNTAYDLIDSHDHSSGKGIAITPSGLNISSDLSFAQNNATNLRTTRFFNNSSFTGGINDKTCLYALNNELFYVDGSGNTVQITSGGALDVSVSITTLTLKDSTFTLEYFGDTSKAFRLDGSLLQTSSTNVFSVPNIGTGSSNTGTLVELAATQTLTHKTLGTGSVITGATAVNLISGSGTLTLPTSGTVVVPNGSDTLANLTGTQTLTGKTLTGNIVANVSVDGTHTMTFQASNDTIVGRATTDTLTNKTLSGNTAVTLVSGAATITLPTTTGTLATLANAETLSNKSITGPLIMLADTGVQFNNSGNTFSTTLKAGTNTGNVTFTLPIADGTSGQVIQTNASGVLSFTSVTATTSRGDTATASTIAALSSSTSVQRLTGSTATVLQGIAAGNAGQSLIVYNVSSAEIEIAHQNSSATAANRIINASGVNVALQPNWCAYFIYDDSQSRWITAHTTTAQEWIAYTPALSAGYGTTSGNAAFYKVVGDSIFVKGSFTAGTTSGTIASFGLPSGFVISAAKLSISGNTTSQPGTILGLFSSASNPCNMVAAPGTSTSVVYSAQGLSGTAPNTPVNANNVNTGAQICYAFEVPIV